MLPLFIRFASEKGVVGLQGLDRTASLCSSLGLLAPQSSSRTRPEMLCISLLARAQKWYGDTPPNTITRYVPLFESLYTFKTKRHPPNRMVSFILLLRKS